MAQSLTKLSLRQFASYEATKIGLILLNNLKSSREV